MQEISSGFITFGTNLILLFSNEHNIFPETNHPRQTKLEI